MTVDIPNVSTAITNTGKVDLVTQYGGVDKIYEFPKPDPKTGKPKPVVVPFAVAHAFFGFEIKNGRLYRNTDSKYPDGDQTAYYASRASFLPWGWEHSTEPCNPDAPLDKQVSKAKMFAVLRDTWENHIEGKLLGTPKELSIEQYEALS